MGSRHRSQNGRSPALVTSPKAVRTQVLGLLGPKTILYRAFGLFFAPQGSMTADTVHASSCL